MLGLGKRGFDAPTPLGRIPTFRTFLGRGVASWTGPAPGAAAAWAEVAEAAANLPGESVDSGWLLRAGSGQGHRRPGVAGALLY